jgi:hypothetical protein
VSAPFAFTATLQPNQDSSWAAWQATFDEIRVLRAEAYWNVFSVASPTVLPANSPNAICVYEPASTVVLTSVNAGMQYERFSLLRINIPFGGAFAAPLTSPFCVNDKGFVTFKTKVPKGPLVSNVTTNSSSGLWRPTTDASNYDWGAFQFYISTSGTNGQLRAETFVRMECELRCRR